MKLSHLRSSSRSGFTLVELLVVIGIIAILAAVVLSGANQAINSARRMKTLSMGNQIATAVQNYYTEYSFYPTPANQATAQDTYYAYNDRTAWEPMIVALCGGLDPGLPQQGQVANNAIPNSRQISYLSPNRADLDTTKAPAVIKTPFLRNGTAQYYFMAVDTNYDTVLGDKDQPAGKIPNFAGAKANTALTMSAGITAGVAVWSNCDQDPTGNAATNPNYWVHTF